jgi:peptidoglycan/xylan/chitin deacetylase (PgdA/CDA1 family)
VTGRGPRRRELYLTFDDGPNPGATPLVLETLARESVPAAFFLVGEHVRRFPAIARAVAEAGHQIGNHTMRHRKLHRLGPRAIERELREAHLAIADATGVAPRLFRAPHGYRNPFVARSARRLGYRTIGWTFGVRDSDPIPAGEIRRRVRARLRPGAIILLHDGDGYDPAGDRRATGIALADVIRDAREAGYSFRRLADL